MAWRKAGLYRIDVRIVFTENTITTTVAGRMAALRQMMKNAGGSSGKTNKRKKGKRK